MNREIVVVVSNDNEGITPIETIKTISDARFKNVFIQWYNKDWECSQEEQLEYINKLGLKVIFAHLGYKGINSIWALGEAGERLVDYYKKDIDSCKKNNIPMVVMHLTSSTTAPEYSEIGLNRLKKITDYAKKQNIKVAFENTKIKGYLDYVLTNIKDDNVGICFDSGHCHAHFDDDFDFKLFKDRIFAVHLHDNDKTDDLHLLPFEGTINWDLLMDKLNYCNYNGDIMLELIYWKDYLDLSPTEFYKKGYEVGGKLLAMFEKLEH